MPLSETQWEELYKLLDPNQPADWNAWGDQADLVWNTWPHRDLVTVAHSILAGVAYDHIHDWHPSDAVIDQGIDTVLGRLRPWVQVEEQDVRQTMRAVLGHLDAREGMSLNALAVGYLLSARALLPDYADWRAPLDAVKKALEATA